MIDDGGGYLGVGGGYGGGSDGNSDGRFGNFLVGRGGVVSGDGCRVVVTD